MTIKTNGLIWKRYYSDGNAWPDGWFHEDEIVIVNGIVDDDEECILSDIPDDAVVSVSGGAIYNADSELQRLSVEGHFRKWLKKQQSVSVLVEVHKNNLDALKSAIVAAGGKIVA